jgi:hypothetical protein
MAPPCDHKRNSPLGPAALAEAAKVLGREGQAAGSPPGLLPGDSCTTMRYDRSRVSLDRHATYIVAAFLAGAAR